MKIVVDILTPKQCMFSSKLLEKLEARGHQVFKTTREYREVVQLLRLKGIEAKVVGEHGGKELIDKLRASAQRTLELASLFEDLQPDIAVSFSSPEMARVSYGLGVPHVCINDSPHAEAVARLTIPLSMRLLTPKIIPKKTWTEYGITPDKIIQYNALDPWVWLKDFKPDKGILKELRLDESKPILTFRTEETAAAYLLGKTQEETSIMRIIDKLLETAEDLQIVAIPRYNEQPKTLREAFKDKIVIPGSTVDAQSLLSYTSVFVGGGGTMTTEAALLGIPTFSCYPDEPFLILKYLIGKELVTRETDPNRLVRRILATLGNISDEKKRQAEKVQGLVQNFEDPTELITTEIQKLA